MTHLSPRGSTPAVLFGLLFAGVFSVLVLGFETLTAVGAFALLVGLYLGLTGWLPWARLGLILTTVGMIGAGLGLMALGVILLWDSASLVANPIHAVPVLIVILAGPLLLWLDSRFSRDAWETWDEAIRQASLADFLTGRHLRSSQ